MNCEQCALPRRQYSSHKVPSKWKVPQSKQERLENIATLSLELSVTDFCINHQHFTRYQFSFGHCCLKQEKACSSVHQFLLWMCPGRKALASTVTLKYVCIHSESSG